MATCIFFSTRVPFKENAKLKQEMAFASQQRSTASQFMEHMEKTIQLLDSVNLPGVHSELIDADIDENLKSMNSIIRSDTVDGLKTLYGYVVETFYDLKKAKMQLREASNNDNSLTELQKQNSDLQARLQITANELQSCQMILSNQLKQR